MKMYINKPDKRNAKQLRQNIAAYLREKGLTNSEIADLMGLSTSTVRNYIGKQPWTNRKPSRASKPELETQTANEFYVSWAEKCLKMTQDYSANTEEILHQANQALQESVTALLSELEKMKNDQPAKARNLSLVS